MTKKVDVTAINRFQILILLPNIHIFKKEKVPFWGMQICQNNT